MLFISLTLWFHWANNSSKNRSPGRSNKNKNNVRYGLTLAFAHFIYIINWFWLMCRTHTHKHTHWKRNIVSADVVVPKLMRLTINSKTKCNKTKSRELSYYYYDKYGATEFVLTRKKYKFKHKHWCVIAIKALTLRRERERNLHIYIHIESEESNSAETVNLYTGELWYDVGFNV